ncbi:D-amino acid aminotransferase [Endothiovibrio diazotrophicus]
MSLCYLNGEQLPLDQAKVSVLDRGFLLGDGVYEVIPAYGGHLFRLTEHLTRLQSSLDGVRIPNPLSDEQWAAALEAVLGANGGGDQSVYLQVSRGPAAKRDHAFPQEVHPTVFIMSAPLSVPPAEQRERGIEVVTLEDNRWLRCNLKTIALLPNVLLRQEALDQEAQEAILVRDGFATEGAATNFLLVKGGVIVTPPKDHQLLPGVTRDLVLELARAAGLPCEERAVAEAELKTADELWITSSTKEILPVTRLDGQPVGDGAPGPLYQQMIEVYQTYKAQLRRGA